MLKPLVTQIFWQFHSLCSVSQNTTLDLSPTAAALVSTKPGHFSQGLSDCSVRSSAKAKVFKFVFLRCFDADTYEFVFSLLIHPINSHFIFTSCFIMIRSCLQFDNMKCASWAEMKLIQTVVPVNCHMMFWKGPLGLFSFICLSLCLTLALLDCPFTSTCVNSE